MQPTLKEGTKYDEGKLRYDLLPPDAVQELVRVYDYGALKYADRNWEKGMKWSRCFSALMRHSWAFWMGENLDPESGLPHMAHAAFCCLALIRYVKRNKEFDDRVLLTESQNTLDSSKSDSVNHIIIEHETRPLNT